MKTKNEITIIKFNKFAELDRIMEDQLADGKEFVRIEFNVASLKGYSPNRVAFNKVVPMSQEDLFKELQEEVEALKLQLHKLSPAGQAQERLRQASEMQRTMGNPIPYQNLGNQKIPPNQQNAITANELGQHSINAGPVIRQGRIES